MSVSPAPECEDLSERLMADARASSDSDMEALAALRAAYARIVRQNGYQLKAVDRRLDKERAHRPGGRP